MTWIAAGPSSSSGERSYLVVLGTGWGLAPEVMERADLRLEAWSLVFAREYYGDVLASADRAVSALEDRSTLSDEELVINAYRASQYKSPLAARETYNELTSIGAIGLIRDQSLRNLAISLYEVTEFEEKRTDEERNNLYRQLFRMIMPITVQRALLKNCGDKSYVREDYESILKMLDYPCSTGLSEQEITSAANALRAHPEILPFLRLRMADVETRLTDTASFEWIDQLREIAPEMP